MTKVTKVTEFTRLAAGTSVKIARYCSGTPISNPRTGVVLVDMGPTVQVAMKPGGALTVQRHRLDLIEPKAVNPFIEPPVAAKPKSFSLPLGKRGAQVTLDAADGQYPVCVNGLWVDKEDAKRIAQTITQALEALELAA